MSTPATFLRQVAPALTAAAVFSLGAIAAAGLSLPAEAARSGAAPVPAFIKDASDRTQALRLALAPTTPASAPTADRARIQKSFGQLPLSFIENRGQADARIAYYIQSPGHSLYFAQDGHTLRLTQGKGDDAKAHTIKVELLDAAPERIESLQAAQGIVSYFKGPKEHWKTAIPTHGKIGYVQPWPGIDLAYDGANGKLESIYTVAPNADPGRIKLRYSGQDALRLDDEGNLVYTTSLGEIKETAPIAWQDIDGQRLPVETRFTLLDDRTVAFQVAEYHPGHALVIDPTLLYAGYIGGSGNDWGYGIAVDSAGNAYVTGYTTSTEATFPVTVGPDLTQNGGDDAFVAKIGDVGGGFGNPGPLVTILINGLPGEDVVIAGVRDGDTRSHTPVKIEYKLNESAGLELFVIVQAPPLGINWSYLDAAGKFIPVPSDYSKITPYKPKGLDPDTYTLFNGILPAGIYELYIALDFAANGHLDYQFPGVLNGRYAYARIRVY